MSSNGPMSQSEWKSIFSTAVGLAIAGLVFLYIRNGLPSEDALVRMRQEQEKRSGQSAATPAPAAVGPAREHLANGKQALQWGRYDEALAAFDEALKHDPKLAEAYFYRGAAYEKKGDAIRSVRDQDRAVRLDPSLANREKP
jgi:tetratricopeptide (TPR) repeat protein